MTVPTATAIKTAIDGIKDFPYPIRVYTYTPKFSLFPYITVRKTPPVQIERDVITKTTREGFEITLYIRYTRKQEDEEANQTTIETLILDEVDQIDFGASALYMESRNWQRTAIPKLYGSQSKLSIIVVDKSSISGEGVLGSETTLTLPSGSKVKILALNSREGPALDTHVDDDAITFRDFSAIDQGDYTMEYESIPTINNEIRSISLGSNVNVTLVKGGVTRPLSVLFGETSKRGQFDIIERATTRFTIQSEVGSQTRLSQISINVIIQ